MPRLFADYTALLIHESFPKMERLANSKLSNISKWIIANRLTVHPNKTLVLNVSPFFCIQTAPELALTLDNVKIKNPSAVKYLGVLLDNNLFLNQKLRIFNPKYHNLLAIFSINRHQPRHQLFAVFSINRHFSEFADQ